MNEFPGTIGRRPRGRLYGAFPWPFVGTAVILSALVVLTPVLFSSGAPSPGFLTAADLIVDRVTGANVTHFYVRAVGSTVRYQSISVGIATGFAWNGGRVTFPSSWTWTNESDVLELGLNSSGNPIALNVTVEYAAGGSVAYYAGVLAFDLAGTGSGETLSIAVSPTTAGVFAPSSLSVGQLPEPIGLQDFGDRSPP